MPAALLESFERVRQRLRSALGQEVFSSWFGRMMLMEVAGPVVRHSVPTTFLRSWINSHYLDTLLEIWKEERSETLKVEVLVRSATRLPRATVVSGEFGKEPAAEKKTGRSTAQSKAPATAPSAGKLPDIRHGIFGSPLDPRFTFESFVEGPSNRVAHAAARAVSEAGGKSVRFNPLYIHASVGLGKTHLLQAIADEAIRQNANARVVYLTAEYFMWRFATAIRDNNALSFKEQLRDIDLLVIDDMQFLQGKTIQNEFCHLINTLLDSAKQVVVAADRPAGELESLEERVRSRLNGGVILEMGRPDDEMRMQMLRGKLETAQMDDPTLSISDEVLQHIARTVTGSGRELEGAFNQLLFRQSLEPEMTIEKVDEFLAHIYKQGEPKRIRIEDIQRVVAKHYNVSKTELLSNRRTRTVVLPRQIAMFLSKVLTLRSLPEIGRRFGGKDHTTVLHAVRKIEGLLEKDKKLDQEVELLKRLINEQA
nr:chromosomal replication initiator protein DnaA [Notoacmeibacter ruber]